MYERGGGNEGVGIGADPYPPLASYTMQRDDWTESREGARLGSAGCQRQTVPVLKYKVMKHPVFRK